MKFEKHKFYCIKNITTPNGSNQFFNFVEDEYYYFELHTFASTYWVYRDNRGSVILGTDYVKRNFITALEYRNMKLLKILE